MKNIAKFSDRLTELMFDKGNLSPEQLGAILGIAASTIRCWKNGSRSIQLSYAVKLAGYFNCSLDFLCGRSETIIDFAPQKTISFYDGLMLYMKQNGISRYKIVKETKLSNGNFESWRKGSDPKIQTVIELADYLGTTIDSFICRDNYN